METSFKKHTRNRLKRAPARGHYDKKKVYEILDDSLLCHVGYNIDGQPYVTPTTFWREGDVLYWHASAASRMMKQLREGVQVCFTVSHLDGLVMARSAFHHSLNYRSVMAFGETFLVEEADEKNRQLKIFLDRLAPDRWNQVRQPTPRELRLTSVIGMKIEDAVAKMRTGLPNEDEADFDIPVWAGVVPIATITGPAFDDGRLLEDVEMPEEFNNWSLAQPDSGQD